MLLFFLSARSIATAKTPLQKYTNSQIRQEKLQQQTNLRDSTLSQRR
jgi:hypothetical protein